jgi:hypothetical protein
MHCENTDVQDSGPSCTRYVPEAVNIEAVEWSDAGKGGMLCQSTTGLQSVARMTYKVAQSAAT